MTPAGLRSIREALHMTPAELASRLGLSSHEILAMERGELFLDSRRLDRALLRLAPAASIRCQRAWWCEN